MGELASQDANDDTTDLAVVASLGEGNASRLRDHPLVVVRSGGAQPGGKWLQRCANSRIEGEPYAPSSGRA